MEQQNELHPVIDSILDYIRKRTEENEEGDRVVVEEYVIPDEFIPLVQEELLAIQDEAEKREAVLSIFAFSMMVEKQGWPENAKRIKELAMALGDIYYDLQQTIANRLNDKSKKQVDDFIGVEQDHSSDEEEDFEQDETFDPTLDDDFL